MRVAVMAETTHAHWSCLIDATTAPDPTFHGGMMLSVLIIDDNLDFAELVAESLGVHGIECLVLSPSNLHEAQLVNRRFDVAVIDVDHIDPSAVARFGGQCVFTTVRDVLPPRAYEVSAAWVTKPCALGALAAKVIQVAREFRTTRVP